MASTISTKSKHPARHETPFVVWFWAMGLAFLSYVVARFVLYSYPHPYHWASAAAGALLGYLAGWLWYRRRGDISI